MSFTYSITQWRAVAEQLQAKLPKLAALMDKAESDVLAFMSFPKPHRVQIRSTNPLERLNAEIKRRTENKGEIRWQPAKRETRNTGKGISR